jgi:hypothetical protein
VKEISLILRNKLNVSIEEFRILNRYSCPGKIWHLIQRPTPVTPFASYDRTAEYILDPEALTFFYILSTNILATWDTDITRDFGPNDELQLKESLFIRPYTS